MVSTATTTIKSINNILFYTSLEKFENIQNFIKKKSSVMKFIRHLLYIIQPQINPATAFITL